MNHSVCTFKLWRVVNICLPFFVYFLSSSMQDKVNRVYFIFLIRPKIWCLVDALFYLIYCLLPLYVALFIHVVCPGYLTRSDILHGGTCHAQGQQMTHSHVRGVG